MLLLFHVYLGNCRIFLTWNNSIPQSSSISIFFPAILMKLCHEVTKTNLEGADFMEGFCNLICSLLDWNSNRQFSCIFLPTACWGLGSDKLSWLCLKYINYETLSYIESLGMLNEIPTWYWPLVIFSNYFLSSIGDLTIWNP